MAAGGGGAWKVAYADFVTAMMAFFMVMWITAQNEKMKMAVAHYFNDPFNSSSKSKGPEQAGSTTTGKLEPGSKEMMPSHRPGDPLGIKRPKDAPKLIGRPIAATGTKAWAGEGNKAAGIGKPTVYVLNNGQKDSAGTVVLFPEEATELDDTAKEQLKRLAPVLDGKRQKIEIRGHAWQSSGADGDADAWKLSYARCVATMNCLVKLGIEPGRMRLSQAGGNEPRTISVGSENQTLNSYVDVIVLPELTDDFYGSREERAVQDSSP